MSHHWENPEAPASQLACCRCGVLRSSAVRPLSLTARGWICGHCANQLELIARNYPGFHPGELLAAKEQAAQTPAESQVLAALGSGTSTWGLLKERLRCRRADAWDALHALVTRGEVVREGNGSASEPFRYRRR